MRKHIKVDEGGSILVRGRERQRRGTRTPEAGKKNSTGIGGKALETGCRAWKRDRHKGERKEKQLKRHGDDSKASEKSLRGLSGARRSWRDRERDISRGKD